MHTTTIISRALRAQGLIDPIMPTAEGVCCLTGETGPAVDRKSMFGKSFTMQHLFSAPESQLLSVSAAEALSYKWERMSCWYVTGTEFSRIGKAEARDIIFHQRYPDSWWAAYITTSYKKHGALTTPPNLGRSHPVWGFDELAVDLSDFSLLQNLYFLLYQAKADGVPQSVLETLDPDPAFIGKFGLAKWLSLRDALMPHRDSVRYKFTLYLLPSHDEIKTMEAEP